MGLAWVRLDTDWPTNPKVAMLVGLGSRGKSAAYAYAAGLCYSGQHGLDGFVPRYALPLVNITPRDAELLTEYELWHPDGDGGWRINDWTDYQESSEETQARSERARQAAQKRWSKGAASNAASNAGRNARRIAKRNAEENRREQKTENRSSSPSDEGSPKSTRATSEASK